MQKSSWIIFFVTILLISLFQFSLNAQDMNAWYGSSKVDTDYHHAPKAALEKWRDLKFGMRIHWGVYSTLGVDASWPLTHSSKEFQKIYRTMYEIFNPTDFNADRWAKLAEKAGMKYFVFTAKHHDGFSMYNTKTKTEALRRVPGYMTGIGGGIGKVEKCYIHYSIMDTRYKHDILGELIKAFRKRGLGVGIYFSHIDWNDPDFRWDPKAPDYDSTYNQKTDPNAWAKFIEREKEQLNELTTNYGRIDQLALDGNWPKAANKNLIKIIKMVRKNQPDVLIRKRGIGPYGDYQTPEHWVPSGPDDPRLHQPWQAIEQLETDWAWTPNGVYKSKEWILHTLIETNSMGGNFMVGISPMPNGRFPKETVSRLLWVGKWLHINGEAIYKTRPYTTYKEGKNIYYTRSKDNKYVYAIYIGQPSNKVVLKYAAALPGTKIKILGYKGDITYKQTDKNLTIKVPNDLYTVLGKQYAYVFKIEKKDFTLTPKLNDVSTFSIGKPITARLNSSTKGAKIYYTLDGSLPDQSSKIYAHPITIKHPCILKAVTVKKGLMEGPPLIQAFSILNKVKNGLRYKYYLGKWKEVPNFDKMAPISSGHIHTFDFSKFKHRQNHYGLRFEGYVYIPKNGNYIFYSETDDGSKLYIDNHLIVNNDGSHGPTEKEGDISLKKGMHKIMLDYFQDYQGVEIKLSYEGPGIPKMEIPYSQFYVTNNK